LKEVEQKGKDAAGGDKYRASKTLAEKAAWAEVETKKPTWDLATINPPMVSGRAFVPANSMINLYEQVFGPILQQVEDPSNLNTSVSMLYKIIHAKEGETPKETLLQPNM
jgi:hypothetical protein